MSEPKCLTGMRLAECWGYNLDVEELKEVNAYINQLEQENIQLKEQVSDINFKLEYEKENLKFSKDYSKSLEQRIDKAIEYIKRLGYLAELSKDSFIVEERERKELLSILQKYKGDNNE